MKIKTTLIVMGMLLPLLSVKAQTIKPLHIGDTVPNLVLHNVINYKDSVIRLSDFKDKLVILDFWATWCGSCLQEMPRLERLASLYGKTLVLLTVTKEPKEKVQYFLKRNNFIAALNLPIITEDSTLHKIFPHRLIPHEVWIQRNRNVYAITYSGDVTEETITNAISGKPCQMVVKSDIFTEGQSTLFKNGKLLYDDISLSANALKSVNIAMSTDKTLLDYNKNIGGATYNFTEFGPEVIFHSSITLYNLTNATISKVDSVLTRSYSLHDQRQRLFFKRNSDGSFGFTGNYTGNYVQFHGVAVDELMLTAAECYARLGQLDTAGQLMHRFLANRYENGFVPEIVHDDANKLLDFILEERRKELLMRGLRWIDLKRLNTEKGRQAVITRLIEGTRYQLLPNSPAYALPIPQTIIDLTGIDQNIN